MRKPVVAGDQRAAVQNGERCYPTPSHCGTRRTKSFGHCHGVDDAGIDIKPRHRGPRAYSRSRFRRSIPAGRGRRARARSSRGGPGGYAEDVKEPLPGFSRRRRGALGETKRARFEQQGRLIWTGGRTDTVMIHGGVRFDKLLGIGHTSTTSPSTVSGRWVRTRCAYDVFWDSP